MRRIDRIAGMYKLAPEDTLPMKLSKLPALIAAAAIAVVIAASGIAHAILLNCPPAIVVKAAGAPYPWTDSSNRDAVLHFAEASYSCSAGTCSLSCAYSMSSSVYTFLDYKVPPGVCHYTNQGQSFACDSLPPPRRHK
jgi:hypothetical protein